MTRKATVLLVATFLASLIGWVLLVKVLPVDPVHDERELAPNYARVEHGGLVTWVAAPRFHALYRFADIATGRPILPLHVFFDNNTYADLRVPEAPVGVNYTVSLYRGDTEVHREPGQIRLETEGVLHPGERTGGYASVKLPAAARSWEPGLYRMKLEFKEPGPPNALELVTCLAWNPGDLSAEAITSLYDSVHRPGLPGHRPTFRAWVNTLLVPLIEHRWFLSLVFVVVLAVVVYALLDVVERAFRRRVGIVSAALEALGIACIALSLFAGLYFVVEAATVGWNLTLGDGANLFDRTQGVFHLLCLAASIVLLGLGTRIHEDAQPTQAADRQGA